MGTGYSIHQFQLGHVDRIGILSTRCHAGNLPGNGTIQHLAFFIILHIAYRNCRISGFPGSAAVRIISCP